MKLLKITSVLCGVIWMLGGLWLIGLVCAVIPQTIIKCRMAFVGDYDYLPEIQGLYAAGKLSEAEDIADFLLIRCDGSNRVELVQLRDKIHSDSISYWGMTKRAGKGFIIGDGETTEEIVGGIASDMVLYGDLRDLAKQSYYKIVGKQTDSLVVGLALLGVVTEFADAVDWFPSLLKACRKAGTLSKKFGMHIAELCKKSGKARKVDPGLLSACRDLKLLSSNAGAAGTIRMMKYVDDVDDLKAVAKLTKNSPGSTSLLLKQDGIKGVKKLGGLNPKCTTGPMLDLAAKKGRRGFDVLQRWGRNLRRIERMYRAFPLIRKLIEKLLLSSVWCRIIIILLGCLCELRAAMLFRRAFAALQPTSH